MRERLLPTRRRLELRGSLMHRGMWIVAGLLVLFLLLVGGVIAESAATRRAGERRLRAAEADLDRTDPGWRLADILAARDAVRPPDDRNLTRLVQDIHARRSAEFNQWETDHGGKWLPDDRNRVPRPPEEAAVRAAVATNREAVELARTVRTRPTGGWPLVIAANPLGTNLEHVQRAREAAHVLQIDAVLAALSGDRPRAAAAVADGLHLVHAIGDDPFAISHLVRMALAAVACESLARGLGLGELPPETLADLEKRLLAEADYPRLLVSTRGERALAHDIGERLADGRLSWDQLMELDGEKANAWTRWRMARSLPADRADLLTGLTDLVAVSRRPPAERAGALVARPPLRRSARLTLTTLLATTDHIVEADLRTIAKLRTAAAAAACERHRLTTGRWPDAIPAPVPTDPYSGQPVRLKRLADGLVIYSTGSDLTDDDGTLGEGRGVPGEDVGFRLWDVAARRQPPPPTSPDEWLVITSDAGDVCRDWLLTGPGAVVGLVVEWATRAGYERIP